MKRLSVRLAPSPLHGVGVFAAKPFQRGEVVGRMQTAFMGSVTAYQGLPTVGVVVSGGRFFAVTGGPFPFWYVNYAASPNIGADRTGRIVALDAIAGGEELTLGAF